MKTVTFTGHRPNKIKDRELEKELLKYMLFRELYEEPSEYKYIVGGCPGFDTIALEVLLELDIPKENIEIAVPFIGFEKYAGDDGSQGQENYETMKFNKSCEVNMIEVGGREGTFGTKCYKRNQYMVENSDIIFTDWNGSNGGTHNTIKLAEKKGIDIVNIRKVY